MFFYHFAIMVESKKSFKIFRTFFRAQLYKLMKESLEGVGLYGTRLDY